MVRIGTTMLSLIAVVLLGSNADAGVLDVSVSKTLLATGDSVAHSTTLVGNCGRGGGRGYGYNRSFSGYRGGNFGYGGRNFGYGGGGFGYGGYGNFGGVYGRPVYNVGYGGGGFGYGVPINYGRPRCGNVYW